MSILVLFTKLQTHISSCLPSSAPWMSNGHLRFNMSKQHSYFLPIRHTYPLLSCSFELHYSSSSSGQKTTGDYSSFSLTSHFNPVGRFAGINPKYSPNLFLFITTLARYNQHLHLNFSKSLPSDLSASTFSFILYSAARMTYSKPNEIM